MKTIDIVIIGLGRVGTIILEQMIEHESKGINIVAVSEIAETPGKSFARDKKINMLSLEEIINLKEKIDLIFDLTGNMDVRSRIRQMLKNSNNSHTVVVTENISALISLLASGISIPDVHKSSGY
jgi:predicted dinucleotide-utilizing enzyme